MRTASNARRCASSSFEAEVEPVAQVHPGRRDAEPVNTPDAGRVGARRERIRRAGVVGRFVTEERGDVPGDSVTEAHDPRVPGRVDEFVHLVRVEPVEEAEVGDRRRERCLARRTRPEGPAVGRDRPALAVDGVADGECGMRRIGVRRLVAHEAVVALERQRVDGGPGRWALRRIRRILDADPGDDRAAVGLHRDRQVRTEPRRRRGDVAGPAGVHQGVAQAKEQSVAGLGIGPGRQRGEGLEAELDRVPAVVDAVQHLPVAACHVDRLDDEERSAELNHPPLVPGDAVEVDDHRVERILRIHFQVDGAVEALEWPGGAEFLPAGVRRCPLHFDPDDPRVGRRRRQSAQQTRQDHECDCSSAHCVPPWSTWSSGDTPAPAVTPAADQKARARDNATHGLRAKAKPTRRGRSAPDSRPASGPR